MNLFHGGNIRFYREKYNLKLKNIIDFSANINPFGFPESIKDIIIKNILLLAHYPDPECKNLIKALANNLSINCKNICVGNGSIEIIYLISKVINPKNTLIYLPTFSEYEISARKVGSEIIYIKAHKEEDFKIDINKIINLIPKVELIFLCNPNNPTGYLIPKEEIDKLTKKCEEYQTYLVIDEVFMGFVDNEEALRNITTPILRNYLIVINSFTKFFGLPGIRLGYCIANTQLIKKLNDAKYCWSVGTLALSIGEKIIKDKRFIQKTKNFIKNERVFLYNKLNNIGFIKPYFPTANFILCEIVTKKITSPTLANRLAKHGILIRDCSDFKGLNNKFFRIAVKTRKENIKLIKWLQSYVHIY